MTYDAESRRGRIMLAVLLCLTLLLSAADGLKYSNLLMHPVVVGVTVLSLLPQAVICWSIWRGGKVGLVLFCISAVRGVGALVGMLQFGGVSALNWDTALFAIQLAANIIVLLSIFRYDPVARYWSRRQLSRTRNSLILELVLFGVAVLLTLLLPQLLLRLLY